MDFGHRAAECRNEVKRTCRGVGHRQWFCPWVKDDGGDRSALSSDILAEKVYSLDVVCQNQGRVIDIPWMWR